MELRKSKVRNKKLSWDGFLKQREQVFATHPETRKFDLDEAIEYSKSLPPQKRMNEVFAKAKNEGHIILSGHGGRASIEETVELFTLKQSYVDFLRIRVDSRTCNNEYKEAEEILRESKRVGRSLANGVPVVAHGVDGVRRIVAAVHKPVGLSAAGTDPRLYHEIAYAAGITGHSGNGPSIFTTYNGNVPYDVVIGNWQYVERLGGIYTEHGAPMFRELPDPSLGAICPPSLNVVHEVICSLITAEQGVRSISNYYMLQCSILQGVAAVRVTKKLVREYLDRFGYQDTKAYQEVTSPTMPFPPDRPTALALMVVHALVAPLSGADAFFGFKTTEEAKGLPSIEFTVEAVAIYRAVLDTFKGQLYPESIELSLEMQMMEKEARLILERILELGDGDIVVGWDIACQTGEYDLPFASTVFLQGRVLPAKDKTGFARFLDCAKLPFTPEIKEFHREKVLDRAKAEGREPDIQLTIEDALAGLLPEIREFETRAR